MYCVQTSDQASYISQIDSHSDNNITPTKPIKSRREERSFLGYIEIMGFFNDQHPTKAMPAHAL